LKGCNTSAFHERKIELAQCNSVVDMFYVISTHKSQDGHQASSGKNVYYINIYNM